MRPRLRPLVLLAAALAAAPSAHGQDEPEPAPARDLRPPVAAYTVLDGVRIPSALQGLSGDAARGEALFADPETGGCTSCHAAPGHPRVQTAPRILRDRLPDVPPPEPEPPADALAETGAEAAGDEAGSASDSPLAPREVAVLPAPRPALDAAGEPEDPGAAPEPERPPLLPLPPAPDLAGAADRLTQGRLRLWVVNPGVADPDARMPAYHDVSLPLARRNPDLRQPWLSPQEVEDVVAYLLTLGGAEAEAEDAPHGDVTPGDDPPR